MILWWIGNIVLLAVVFPVVLVLLNKVVSPIETIRETIDDILRNAVYLHGLLEGIPEKLAVTDETVKEVAAGALRYGSGLDELERTV